MFLYGGFVLLEVSAVSECVLLFCFAGVSVSVYIYIYTGVNREIKSTSGRRGVQRVGAGTIPFVSL